MASRNERPNHFFKLPVSYQRDSQIMQVSAQAELLFVRLIDLSNSVQSYGRLSAAQVQSCARGLRSLRRCCAELVQAELLAYADLTQEYHLTDCVRWYLDQPNANVSRAKPQPKTAAQKASAPPSPENAAPRAGARVETDRQTDRESFRSPTGSDRNDSARAAPRGTGGAAQPAPDGSGKLSRSDAIALAKAEVQKGRAKNPAATGIDTKFSKYDPNRPITPITSALVAGRLGE